jgi:hypothetical protein
MAALKLKEARGVEVTLVDQDAPAGKAGLKERDVIVSFNGKAIQDGQELRRLIRNSAPGSTVSLGVIRNGQPLTLKAQLADRRKVIVMGEHPIVIPHIKVPHVEIPIITTFARRQGIITENLTPQLGEVFGVHNGEGVLIRSVEKGSVGEAAGLRAGDVIVRVGGERVTSTSDWNRLMREQKPGAVQIGIIRDKRQQAVSLNIPQGQDQSSAEGMEDFNLGMENFNREMEQYGRSFEKLNQLQPDIERAMRRAQERIQRDLERHRHEWQQEAQRARREAQREAQQAQREAEREQREAQREQEKAQKDLEKAQRDQQKPQQELQNTPPKPPQ